MPRCERVQLGEHRLLDLHALGHGLDHEVDVAKAVVVDRAGDAPEDLLELALGVVLGDLLLGHERPELALGDRARLLEAEVDELLLDVLEDDRHAGGRDDLGDLPAHGARAHDCGFEYEHGPSV